MPHSPDSFRQITDVLSKSLKNAFDEVCPERYGGALTFRQLEDTSEEKQVSFRIHGPKTLRLHLHVEISHVGGNVYDIHAQVEDEPKRSFTYSEPDESGSSLSIAPYLGKKIARYLLDDVERRLGKALLRDQVTAEE